MQKTWVVVAAHDVYGHMNVETQRRALDRHDDVLSA
jgi:hypothetical protein